MKIQMLIVIFLLSCQKERVLPEEEKINPPTLTGTFVVKTYNAADIFSEPSLTSRILARVPMDKEVKTYSDLRSVLNSEKGRPTFLLLVQYGKTTGWLDPSNLGFRDAVDAKPTLFKGAINSFKVGCLMAESTENTYKSCGNCGTLDFFPWGGFTGTLGCDDHLHGRWYVQENRIRVLAEGETMCNHFMNTDPATDKDFMKKCLDFQAKSHRSYQFDVFKSGESWVTKPEIELGSQDKALQLYAY